MFVLLYFFGFVFLFFCFLFLFFFFFFFFFFFSSRRRHTRCLSDWSSDVCSSDLESSIGGVRRADDLVAWPPRHAASRASRSEERRVGKECRSRWSPYH